VRFGAAMGWERSGAREVIFVAALLAALTGPAAAQDLPVEPGGELGSPEINAPEPPVEDAAQEPPATEQARQAYGAPPAPEGYATVPTEPPPTIAPPPDYPGGPARAAAPPRACWDERDLRDVERERGAQPSEPCRRSSEEVLELYAWSSAFGLLTGAYVATIAGLKDGVGGGIALLGVAAAALGVYGLDTAMDGMPSGMPGAIWTGILLGLGEGVLISASFGREPFEGSSAAHLTWWGAAVGAGLGGAAGFLLRAEPGDSALVRSGAGWGAFFAEMLNLALREDDTIDALRVVFTGYNVGLVGAAILTSALRVTRLEALYLDAGGVLGITAGALAFGATHAGSAGTRSAERDAGLLMGIGAAGGMVVAFLLANPGQDSEVEVGSVARRAVPEVWLQAMPVEGGAVLAAGGQL